MARGAVGIARAVRSPVRFRLSTGCIGSTSDGLPSQGRAETQSSWNRIRPWGLLRADGMAIDREGRIYVTSVVGLVAAISVN